MTTREKTLAGVLGGAIGLFMLYNAVQMAVIKPFQTLNAELARARTLKTNLEQRVAREKTNQDGWIERTGRTLAADAEIAQQRFGDDVKRLLRKHNLERNGTATNGSPTSSKNGFVTVPVSVNAKGSLAEIVGLVRDLYQRPYINQITRLSLNAGEQKPKSKGGKEDIQVNITAATLVLPKIGTIAPKPMEPEELDTKRNETRLAADPAEYDKIVETNIFRWPEPPIVHRDPDPPVLTTRPGPEIHKPPPQPRTNHVLCGVYALDGQPMAYVRDEDRKTEAPKKHKLGDTIDSGKIVLIHPKGMVVRVENQGGTDGQPQDYFYPLGKNFRDRQPLDPNQHPDLADELRIAAGL